MRNIQLSMQNLKREIHIPLNKVKCINCGRRLQIWEVMKNENINNTNRTQMLCADCQYEEEDAV
jgi:NAD-dependent SIR2 family protein deacetylase